MRSKNVEIKGKVLDDLFIELDDEYMDMDFYYDKKSDYNYIKRKYEHNYMKYGSYISLYRNEYEEKLGYFYLACCMSVKPIYKYPSYTRYAELLEFGFVNNNLEQVKFLIDYLIEYAAARGSLFIKVKTKEKSFKKFYEILRTYKHTEDDKFIYLEFEPVDYDFARHLIKYADDKLSIKELYHLLSMGFSVEKDICKYELQDKDCFIVDRKTRKVTYPERMINIDPKYNTLNQDSLSLMHLVISDDYDYKDKIIDVGYKLKGYDYELIKIGNHLLTFDNFKYDDEYKETDNFIEFAIKAYKEYGFTVLYICEKAKFDFKKFYASFSKSWNYLPNYAGEAVELSPLTKLREKWKKEE